ncbi:alanine--tRNA ligase, partial [archaeon]|nr:alanine--tRNA ligase [archaeon]
KELFIVSIKDWDVEACGGTHVQNTNQIGKAVITGTERIQDGIVRVHFKAGTVADQYLEKMEKLTQETAELLGVNKKDVPTAVEELFAEWKANKKQVELLTKEKAGETVQSMKPEEINGINVYASAIPGADMNTLRAISVKLTAENTVVLLVSDKGALFASSNTKINAGGLVRSLAKSRKGGGGGPPNKGEGKINDTRNLPALLKQAKKQIKELLA